MISGHFSGITSYNSSLTSPWITISSSPVTEEPQANFVPKNFAATLRSIPERKPNEVGITSYKYTRFLFLTKTIHSCNNGYGFLLASRSSRYANSLILVGVFFLLVGFNHSLTTSLLTFLFLFLSGPSFTRTFYLQLLELCRQILFKPFLAFLIFRIRPKLAILGRRKKYKEDCDKKN